MEGSTLVVRAEVPGIDPDQDVDVSVSEGMLHIRVERLEKSEHKSKDGYRSEFRYGSFARSVALPAGAQGRRHHRHLQGRRPRGARAGARGGAGGNHEENPDRPELNCADRRPSAAGGWTSALPRGQCTVPRAVLPGTTQYGLLCGGRTTEKAHSAGMMECRPHSVWTFGTKELVWDCWRKRLRS